MQRNVQLLKDRSWFDIPIVYTNGGRAILAMEKRLARRPRLHRGLCCLVQRVVSLPNRKAIARALSRWRGGIMKL